MGLIYLFYTIINVGCQIQYFFWKSIKYTKHARNKFLFNELNTCAGETNRLLRNKTFRNIENLKRHVKRTEL